MRQTRVIWAVACTLLLVSGCDNGEPREIASEDGHFKVQMPGRPTESTQLIMGLTMYTWHLDQGDVAYGVAYMNFPAVKLDSEEQIQARLQGARDGMVNNLKAKLTRSWRTTLQKKYPGREVEAELPDQKGIMRARIFVAGERFYEVMVLGVKPRVNSPEATKFLDSLVVTP